MKMTLNIKACGAVWTAEHVHVGELGSHRTIVSLGTTLVVPELLQVCTISPLDVNGRHEGGGVKSGGKDDDVELALLAVLEDDTFLCDRADVVAIHEADLGRCGDAR